MPWPHWLLSLSDIKRLVEDGKEMLDRMEQQEDDKPDIEVVEDEEGEEPDAADPYAKLLKDFNRIDFSQTKGVSVYVTDTCYQLYIGEYLFVEYMGEDAREFAGSIVAYNRKKVYRNEDYYFVLYDSGMTSTSLEKTDRDVNYLRLCKHEYKTGLPDNQLPPVVLLRPTAILRYPDWTHAPDPMAALRAIKEQAEDHNPDRVHVTIRACYHLANDALK